MISVCKKCLIGQQTADYLAFIEKNREATPAKQRTAEGEYVRRISICQECEKLSGPTCLGCGCYVELRAMRKDSHCPYQKW